MTLSKLAKHAGLPLFVSILALGLAACDSNGTGIGNNFDDDDDDVETFTQVDRMGRAGVNTAVTDPFFIASNAEQNAAHGEITDRYNLITTQSESVDDFADIFEGNIAIYDGLDTTCGNQLAADQNPDDRYSFLATVLADDQVYVNSASGTCTQYFGVELNALGVENTDCGGRTPLYDVIDVTYSALAIGATSGVGDGVDSDTDGDHSADTFPFLAPPL